jgi:hypothetical protein
MRYMIKRLLDFVFQCKKFSSKTNKKDTKGKLLLEGKIPYSVRTGTLQLELR